MAGWNPERLDQELANREGDRDRDDEGDHLVDDRANRRPFLGRLIAVRTRIARRALASGGAFLRLSRAIRGVGHDYSSPNRSAARKASWGISTDPTIFIRFLPAFCFSSSFRFRVMSPP